MKDGAGTIRTEPAPGAETESRRILESETLRRADRLKELLAYLLSRAASSPETPIREQEIGAAVYGRPPDYDTSHDTIVRVQIAQLRKKLERYYETEGASGQLILTIPRGGYQPVWQRRSPEPAPPPPDEPEPGSKSRQKRWIWAAALCLGLVAAPVAIWRYGDPGRAAFRQQRPFVERLWSQVLTPKKTTYIVLSDPGLVMLANATGRPVHFAELGDRLFFNRLQAWDAAPDYKKFVQGFAGAQLATLSDLEIVRAITALSLQDPDMIRVLAARDFRIRDFNNNNAVLVGYALSNPWVEVFLPSMNFVLENDREARTTLVRNRSPLPGEQPVYRLENAGVVNPAQGYVTLALFPNPTASGKVLIVSGADVPGTEAAIRFMTSEAQWQPFCRSISGGGEVPAFEAVLSYRRLSNSSGDVAPLAWRVHR